MIIDRHLRKVTYTGLYYYLAHFSKFVRPGDIRIKTTGSLDGVRVMAFKAPDGKIVAEVMNSKHEDVEIGMKFHEQVLRLKLPAISITTALWNVASIQPESGPHDVHRQKTSTIRETHKSITG